MKGTIFDLSGRTALITGGSQGLGRAMAHGLARAGAEVMISSRGEAGLRATAAGVPDGTIHYHVADMTSREQVRSLAETSLEVMGRVDILVNNAGCNTPEPIDEISDEIWDRTVELNLTSCMALTRALAPQMKARRWGRIIHISSIMGLGSKEKRNSYSATKAALFGLCRASALDLGAYNVTVNCLAPGPFLTDMPGSLLSPAEKQVFSDRTALGRWAEPEELVGPALMLASEAGSYITGAVLVVDGGVLCKTF